MEEREGYIDGKTSLDTSYYVTSMGSDAEAIAHAEQGHWGIENSLHWVLDIAFREEEPRIRKDHAPANFATIRHMALNLLRKETSLRRSIKRIRLKAGWDTDYLETILGGVRAKWACPGSIPVAAGGPAWPLLPVSRPLPYVLAPPYRDKTSKHQSTAGGMSMGIRSASEALKDEKRKGTKEWSAKSAHCPKNCFSNCLYCYSHAQAVWQGQVVNWAE